MPGTTAMLISRSATSGWTDWIWGELWLFPDGILRVPTDLRTTRRRARARRRAGGGSTAPVKPAVRSMFDDDPARLADESKRTRWVPRNRIDTADLRRGLLNSRLSVRLTDGSEGQAAVAEGRRSGICRARADYARLGRDAPAPPLTSTILKVDAHTAPLWGALPTGSMETFGSAGAKPQCSRRIRPWLRPIGYPFSRGGNGLGLTSELRERDDPSVLHAEDRRGTHLD
jgi:hypothetical protein